MRVERQFSKLDKVASTDETRFLLTHIAIKRTDAEHGFAEATDGRRLVRVPVEFDKDEQFPAVAKAATDRVLMTRAAWVAGFKPKTRFQWAVFTFTADSVTPYGGPTYKLGEGNWVDTDRAIPDIKNWTDIAVLSFDPVLVEGAKAAIWDGKGATIAINAASKGDPWVIGSPDERCVAVVMPMNNGTAYFAGRRIDMEGGSYQLISERKPQTRQEHYSDLSKTLDELVAEFSSQTGINPASTTITALMAWVEEQAAKGDPIPEAEAKPAEPVEAPKEAEPQQERLCMTCRWNAILPNPATIDERRAAGYPCGGCDLENHSNWTPRKAEVTAHQSSSPSEAAEPPSEPTQPQAAG
jgi:hypothetical protein